MDKRCLLIFTVLLLLFNCTSDQIKDNTPQLKLVTAYPINGPYNAQPSGLTIYQNELFTISDKHDTILFRIQFTDTHAELIPHFTFHAPIPALGDRLDYEGITCDNAGNFYIVSETCFKILRVTADGKTATWITPCMKEFGHKEGLFQRRNANFEGVVWSLDQKFILCAEREPRGLMEVDLAESPIKVQAWKMNNTKFNRWKDASLDFTGLFYVENSGLFVLQRNTFTVCELIFSGTNYKEGRGWCYRNTENSESYRYQDMRYGKAEGLAMDEKFIYIILDNNNDTRATDPSDNRPLLFIFQRPDFNQ